MTFAVRVTTGAAKRAAPVSKKTGGVKGATAKKGGKKGAVKKVGAVHKAELRN